MENSILDRLTDDSGFFLGPRSEIASFQSKYQQIRLIDTASFGLCLILDGKVQWYSLLVPTTWNFPTVGRALEGAPWQLAEVIMRAYDPCVSCATHMMVVDDSKKVVAQKMFQ